jgi:hypothetical protein
MVDTLASPRPTDHRPLYYDGAVQAWINSFRPPPDSSRAQATAGYTLPRREGQKVKRRTFSLFSIPVF